ncbi:MAG: phosphoenolpyruvate carboxykinase (GTP) [Chloroflexi bacterium]|nr:phosphoenolpyruvate carboxykinase (GTP) [Chloroflexota bacterium]
MRGGADVAAHASSLVEKLAIPNETVKAWVAERAAWTGVAAVEVIDAADDDRLLREAIAAGELIDLGNGTYYARSHPKDTARTEARTFVGTDQEGDKGRFNNWRPASELRPEVDALMKDASSGKTMYVIPYLMANAPGSPLAKWGIGVELTDSRYVALSMIRMARVGQVAWDALGDGTDFVRGVHVTGDLDNLKRAASPTPTSPDDDRYFVTLTRDREILHHGSAYGGNALLAKIAHGLRLASFDAHQNGWLVDQMGLMGIENLKTGETKYLIVGFPSASGKTNLVMTEPPDALRDQYKVHFLGDDIVWMYVGDDNRIYGMNPEYGVFGVAPGTNAETNPAAMEAMQAGSGTIFTNVARHEETNEIWWEEMTPGYPEDVTGWLDWQGKRISDRPAGEQKSKAHPWAQRNSRFTSPLTLIPNISPEWDNAKGVPISGVIFGGRVSSPREPLIRQLPDPQTGVYDGAVMGVETTAAIDAPVVFRADPMAMMGFYSYPEQDFFQDWLSLVERAGDEAPGFFHVNWFAKDDDGRFMWPGYTENLRALVWAIEQPTKRTGEELAKAEADGLATVTPAGIIPTPKALNTEGLSISEETLAKLLTYDPKLWETEVPRRNEYLAQFPSLPKALEDAHARFVDGVTSS